MRLKPSLHDALMIATGAAIFLVILAGVVYFQSGKDPAAQLAAKARRVELVAGMQRDLASASEAEKSAVMAITDEDSRRFADQARAATAEVQRRRSELAGLLDAGSRQEKDLLAQFDQAFAEFQQTDKDLLDLAVRNTNLKATSLAFGPATAAVNEMDAALSRLPAADANTARLIGDARVAAWRLLAMLPPHIAEESDPKMDQMEAEMAQQDRAVHQSLDALSAMPALAGNADLAGAATAYARFGERRSQILKLSRENTNVRSLSLSLTQKRTIMLMCQASLTALQDAIAAEPVPGLNYDVRPR